MTPEEEQALLMEYAREGARSRADKIVSGEAIPAMLAQAQAAKAADAAPVAQKRPAFSGAGFVPDAPKRQFDFRRAFVAAGGGDVGQYDENRRAAENQQEQKRVMRARLDPNSPESDQARVDFTGQLKLYSQIPGLPEALRKELDATSAGASKMSAAHIDRSMAGIQQMLGFALKGAGIQADSDLAKENMDLRREAAGRSEKGQSATIANMATDNALARERFEYDKKKDEARRGALNVKLTAPDPKVMAQIRDGREIITQLMTAKRLLEQNDFYTGAKGEQLSEAQRQLGGLPLVGNAIAASPEKTSYIQTLGETTGKIRNTLFGQSLTASEKASGRKFLPDENVNKADSMTMLNNMIRKAERQYAQLVSDHAKRTGHPYNATGSESFQQADDAYRGIEQARELARQQLLEMGGTPPSAGGASPQGKRPQTAEEWLAANPDDPRAPAVRAKLEKAKGK